jgi:hypothetical protein
MDPRRRVLFRFLRELFNTPRDDAHVYHKAPAHTVTGSVCRPCLHAFNFSFHLVADVRRRRRLYSFPICYFLFFFSFIFLGAKIFCLLFGCLLFDLEMNRKMKNEKMVSGQP